MTAPADPTAPTIDRRDTVRGRPRRDTSKAVLGGIVVGSLVAASLLRGYVMTSPLLKAKQNNAFVATNATTDQFDSYTLGLLLGGLRGPLVMTLWSSSETQKGERNLEDINTKIELIRLLQPEFDSVHLFQIWNKAYNLSVQMANLPSKYATILDAIDYANRTRADKENINLEAAVAGVYFDKLGSANEKAYYRARVREESQQPRAQVSITFPAARRDEFVHTALAAGADPRRYTLRPASGNGDTLTTRLRDDYADAILKTFTGNDVAVQRFAPRPANAPDQSSFRSRLDPVLDANGMLLPYDANGRALALPLPQGIDDLEWHPEYGDLQYLERFQPFPRGVSPFAFAYNYYKRSVALQISKNQSHSQLSDRVISSRMTLSLKNWAEEDIESGRNAELAQFGKRPMAEDQSPLPLELPTADITIPATAQPTTPLLDEAIYDYTRATSVAQVGIEELRAHLKRYSDDWGTYGNLKADLVMKGELAAADAAYLRLLTTDPAAREPIAREAAAHYARAIELIQRIILAYYIPDEVIQRTFPQEFGKVFGKIDVVNSFDDPRTFPAELIRPTLSNSLRLMGQINLPIGSEIGEYQTYLGRADARLKHLSPLVGQTFATSANLLDPGPTVAPTGPTLPTTQPGARLFGPVLPGMTPTTNPTASTRPSVLR